RAGGAARARPRARLRAGALWGPLPRCGDRGHPRARGRGSAPPAPVLRRRADHRRAGPAQGWAPQLGAPGPAPGLRATGRGLPPARSGRAFGHRQRVSAPVSRPREPAGDHPVARASPEITINIIVLDGCLEVGGESVYAAWLQGFMKAKGWMWLGV